MIFLLFLKIVLFVIFGFVFMKSSSKDSGDYDPDDDCGDPVYKHANDETIINRLRENEEIIKFE